MTKHRISTTVTNTVQLGTNSYADTLTITSTGIVTPQAAGADGIIGRQASDEVTNRGSIVAATGAAGGSGGVGIDLTAGGTIINRGYVAGGTAYGGNGLDARGGTIANIGGITGALKSGGNGQDQGGTGVLSTRGSATIINSGTIAGGGGARGAYAVGTGGVGVDLAGGGTLSNTGAIDGGYTYYGRGVAVELAQHSTLQNDGTIFGGNEKTGGAVVSTNSHIVNNGTIRGVGNLYTVKGAIGVSITGGSVDNTALIQGGAGGQGDHYTAYAAGAGIDASAAEIINSGTIFGGAAYNFDPGANGINLSVKASLSNTGTIGGGIGGYELYARASTGGIGVSLASATSATSSGLIEGGAGGTIHYGDGGGAGGVGVSLATDGTFTNAGTIIGGSGGNAPRFAGYGGDGADINGGTLITSGTIIAGLGGMSSGVYAQAGDAVNFGTVSGTMIIEPGAVFQGAVVGSYSTGDTLVLAGTIAGTLPGFDSTIVGITRISEDADSDWTLQGTITGPGEVDIGKGAQLTLTGGPVSIATIAFAAGGHGTLTLGEPASVTSTFSGFGRGDRIGLVSVHGTSLTYGDGTLTVLGANNAVVATLDFAGSYMPEDFKLQADGSNTDVLYAGGLPDFAPTALDLPDARGGEHGSIQRGGMGWLDTGHGVFIIRSIPTPPVDFWR